MPEDDLLLAGLQPRGKTLLQRSKHFDGLAARHVFWSTLVILPHEDRAHQQI